MPAWLLFSGALSFVISIALPYVDNRFFYVLSVIGLSIIAAIILFLALVKPPIQISFLERLLLVTWCANFALLILGSHQYLSPTMGILGLTMTAVCIYSREKGGLR